MGKHTTALTFARLLLDPELSLTERGELISNKGEVVDLSSPPAHSDVHLINKELALYSDDAQVRNRKLLTIPMDVLRSHLIEPAFRCGMSIPEPGQRAGKVFIVDEAELLAGRAQNVLLKTLEEPPAGTVIILVTTQEDRLLPTIRSRCQRVAFLPLNQEEMQQWAGENLAEMPAEEVEWILDFAQGSPGDALLAARCGFYRQDALLQPLLAELEAGRFPLSMGRTLASFVDTFAADWVSSHANASKDAANKLGVQLVLTLLGRHADRKLRQSAAQPDLVEQWIEAVELLGDCEKKLQANVAAGFLMEYLVVGWHRILSGNVNNTAATG